MIRFIKRTDDAKYFIQQFASQRQILDITCFNNEYEIVYVPSSILDNDKKTGGGLKNHWYLIVYISDYVQNVEGAITFRAIRWNSFQSENDNYFGRLIVNSEDSARLTIVLPHDKKINEHPRLTFEALGEKSEVNPFIVQKNDTLIRVDFFTWLIRRPKINYTYKAFINWSESNEKYKCLNISPK